MVDHISINSHFCKEAMGVILVKKFMDGHLIFPVIRYTNQLNN